MGCSLQTPRSGSRCDDSYSRNVLGNPQILNLQDLLVIFSEKGKNGDIYISLSSQRNINPQLTSHPSTNVARCNFYGYLTLKVGKRLGISLVELNKLKE